MSFPCECWFAAAVKPRHEKFVQQILNYQRFRTSLPLQKCSHTRRSGTKWASEKPLIPGYVFVADDPQNTFRVVAVPGVTHLVGYRTDSSSITPAEIEALERIAASPLRVSECAYVRVGQAVKLVDGPLRGAQGTIIREAGSTRFVVNIEMLQRSLSVEIDGDWAIPVQYPYAPDTHRLGSRR